MAVLIVPVEPRLTADLDQNRPMGAAVAICGDPREYSHVNRHRSDETRLDHVVAAARRARDMRERGYREQALRLLPWVCARCGREFERAGLRELTVHHRDHNHDNNPPDGSNWELLCLYCHDDEHARGMSRGSVEPSNQAEETFKPFENLQDLLNKK